MPAFGNTFHSPLSALASCFENIPQGMLMHSWTWVVLPFWRCFINCSSWHICVQFGGLQQPGKCKQNRLKWKLLEGKYFSRSFFIHIFDLVENEFSFGPWVWLHNVLNNTGLGVMNWQRVWRKAGGTAFGGEPYSIGRNCLAISYQKWWWGLRWQLGVVGMAHVSAVKTVAFKKEMPHLFVL